MSAARELPARDYERLKLATVDLVSGCGGTRRAELHTRVSHQQLGSYLSEEERCRETFMPIDVVADLEAEAVSRGRRPLLTEMLADLSGFILVAKPEVGSAPSDEEALLRVARETTEALSEGWAAKADGAVTAEERVRVMRQVREAIVALVEFEQYCGASE